MGEREGGREAEREGWSEANQRLPPLCWGCQKRTSGRPSASTFLPPRLCPSLRAPQVRLREIMTQSGKELTKGRKEGRKERGRDPGGSKDGRRGERLELI